MAISSTKKPQFLPVLAVFITLFLIQLKGVNSLRSLNRVKSLSPLSFKFDKFEAGQGIILLGDAAIENNVIELTLKDSDGVPESVSVGRAYYSKSLHLWDSVTGQVTDFKTTFTFRLTSPEKSTPAAGLAFFIAPTESTIPRNSTRGFLGLFTPENAGDPSKNHITFVEIDTSTDKWDPAYEHIGINVNVINSTGTDYSVSSKWNREEAAIATVEITYNSASGRLTAVSYYPTSSRYKVTKIVNLDKVLPEYVQIGFSAATGDGENIQTHDILSWSFEAPPASGTAKEKEEEKRYIAPFM